MMFDDWAHKHKKILAPSHKEEIWQSPWIDEFMTVAETAGDVDKFIQEKNSQLYASYANEVIAPIETDKKTLEETLSSREDIYAKDSDFNKQLDEFAQDIEMVVSKYPEERKRYVKSLLEEYYATGKFVPQNDSLAQYNFNNLKQPAKGFFNKIRQGRKIKEANQCLDGFIAKYEKINLPRKLNELEQQKNDSSSRFETLDLKLKSMVELNTESVQNCDAILSESSAMIAQETLRLQKQIQEQSEKIEQYKASFNDSNSTVEEDKIIKNFAQEIRDNIKNPKQYTAADWIEGIENMPDDKLVMFNIPTSKSNKQGIEAILKNNGLSAGDATNQWLLHKESRNNSDAEMYEIFSPIMTVKDAKEVMPKLISDFEKAHISKGLVIPTSLQELFKDVKKEPYPQNIVDDGLEKLVLAGKVREALSNPNQTISEEAEAKIFERLGIKFFEELPQTYGSLKELEAKFPKDKYLFSGTMVSDNYCQLSSRNGRTGKVYATPNIAYAALYDGVTNVGGVTGTSATGDWYVSPTVGKIKGIDIQVGFINVYEQNPQDKFFDNFGMEDCQHTKCDNPNEEWYDVVENTPNGPVFSKMQKPTDHRLSKEQAVNGFINPRIRSTIDGKEYFQLYRNSETYVTPEKNPLKTKIMHLSYKDSSGRNHDLYIPLSDKSDKAIQCILNSRQAEMKDTFDTTQADVHSRFLKQKEEFDKGIVHPAREIDFLLKKQSALFAGESKNLRHPEELQNTDVITNQEINVASHTTGGQQKDIADAKRDKQAIEQTQNKAEEIQIAAPAQYEAAPTTVTPRSQDALSPQAEPLSETSQQKTANLSPREKGRFFHKLRMGVNTILAKADKSKNKTQTKAPQQLSVMQIKAAKDKGGRI